MSEKPPEQKAEQQGEILPENGILPTTEQHEKLSPFFIIYRDNALYRELCPKISETLSSEGYQVQTKVFPKETPEDVIKKWYESIGSDIGKEGLVDGTFIRSIGGKPEGFGYLDYFADKVTKDFVLRADFEAETNDNQYENNEDNADKNLKETEIVFLNLLKQVFENKEKIPKDIYIFSRNITQHEPFIFKRTADGKVVIGADGKPQFSAINAHDVPDQETLLFVLNKLSEWLGTAGISKDHIHTIYGDPESYNDFVVPDSVNKDGVWFICDRHNNVIKHPEQRLYKFLEMPIPTFFNSLKSENLLDPSVVGEKNKEAMFKYIEKEMRKWKQEA